MSAVAKTEDSPATVPAVLRAAADLIEPEGKWTQHCSAKDANGYNCSPFIPAAVCFCAVGAIAAQTPRYTAAALLRGPAGSALQDAIETHDIPAWNDAPSRTQAEVVAALRRAADLAEAGQQ